MFLDKFTKIVEFLKIQQRFLPVKVNMRRQGRWLGGKDHWLLFQRTNLLLPAPTWMLITGFFWFQGIGCPFLASMGPVHGAQTYV